MWQDSAGGSVCDRWDNDDSIKHDQNDFWSKLSSTTLWYWCRATRTVPIGHFRPLGTGCTVWSIQYDRWEHYTHCGDLGHIPNVTVDSNGRLIGLCLPPTVLTSDIFLLIATNTVHTWLRSIEACGTQHIAIILISIHISIDFDCRWYSTKANCACSIDLRSWKCSASISSLFW